MSVLVALMSFHRQTSPYAFELPFTAYTKSVWMSGSRVRPPEYSELLWNEA